MKKIVLAIFCMVVFSFGRAQNAIPNAGFENWTNYGSYEDPDNWGTINNLTSPIFIKTVTKATGADAHSGSYALKMESKNVPIQGTAPGIAATGVINANTQAVDGGVVYSKRPISITGWYKYLPNGVDTGSVFVTLWKWNTGTHSRDEVGSAELLFTATVSTYTQFTANFAYTSSNFPDSMVITLLTSSRAAGSPTGTQLFIDDLAMVLCNNFTANTTNTASVCTAANGTATVTTSNGAGGNIYAWSNSGTTSAITAGAGTYTVTVTDGNGCSASSSSTIASTFTILNPTATATNATCLSSTGSASVTTSAGASPFSYHWSNNANTSPATGLAAGSYQVTVTDANGCSATAATTVGSSNMAITSTVATTATSCASNTGSATATPTNGTATYSFLWSNTQTGGTISNLGAGSYQVTITDGNGCTGTATAAVTTPNGPSATRVVTDITCNGQNNGAIDVTTTGGTNPITYTWSSTANTEDLSNLAAGTYTLTINDVNNCSFTLSGVITEPDVLSAAGNGSNITCFGAGNGSINVTVSGGTPNYSYLWNTTAITPDLSGLGAGTYTLTITDAHSCTASFVSVLTEPTQVMASVTLTDVTCNGTPTGSGMVTATGGASPYTYTWTGGATGPNPTTLAAGAVTVTVSDDNGCTATATGNISEPPALGAVVTATDASSSTATDGSATVASTGGVAAYTYLWSGGQVTMNVSGLAPGNYCVTVTDNNGCTVSDCADVSAPSAIGNLAYLNMQVYPNPANSQLTIQTEPSNGKLQFTIYSVDGKLLSQQNINGTKTTISVAALPAGFYAYQLKDMSCGNVTNGKLQVVR